MNGSPVKGKIFFVCLSTFEFKNQAIRHSALENIKGVVLMSQSCSLGCRTS